MAVPPWQCQSGNDSSSVDRCGNDDSGNATMIITVVAMAAVAMTVVCGLYVKGPSSIKLYAHIMSESFHKEFNRFSIHYNMLPEYLL